MKTTMKKIFAAVMAMAMALSLSATAFAAEESGNTTQHTVTIYVQEATRDAEGEKTSQTVYNQGNPIVVTVNDGQTLKDAINAACVQTGSIITNPQWKPTDDQYLISLDVNGTPYENYDTYEYDTPKVGWATYEGLSWMYFIGAPEDMPASSYSYPDVSLGRATVTGNTTITLSFEYLTYIWETSDTF